MNFKIYIWKKRFWS